jgi:hypothetical protein
MGGGMPVPFRAGDCVLLSFTALRVGMEVVFDETPDAHSPTMTRAVNVRDLPQRIWPASRQVAAR